MKIRFYQYGENKFTMEVRGLFGWEAVVEMPDFPITIIFFKSKQEGIEYIRKKSNRIKLRILEYPSIIVHE